MAISKNVVAINSKAGFAARVEDFVNPQNIQNAKIRIALLTADKESIELQLADRWHAYVKDGCVNGQEYHTWKKKAFSAKCWKMSEIAFLETWIENNPPDTPSQIIKYAKGLGKGELKDLITSLLELID